MTPELWVAVAVVAIPAFAAMVGSGVAMVVGILNHRKINTLSVTVDGRLEQLLEVTGKSQRAEGVVEGGVDAASIEKMIHEALSKALLVPPPPGLLPAAVLTDIQEKSTETLDRVKDIQADTAALAHPEPKETPL